MRGARHNGFFAVRAEGGLISPDIIAGLAVSRSGLPGLRAEDYHLGAERLGEAITRSWNRMRGEWARFQDARKSAGAAEAATGLTRERLLLPLFQELGYGRLQPARGLEVQGKSYPVSHLWGKAPIHLVGSGVELDRRSSGVAGAAQASPHGLVQELLNRSDEHLWGFVSNGRLLRILRDNRSLTRQAYVEIDLEAIFQGELYPDFVVLWMLCHQSRVEAERPEECWLERWSGLGWEQGARALETLRKGVQEAIEHLGRGFLSHRSNGKLRERLRSGALSTQEFYREILRLVYRLLFLFVAEDRDAIHPRDIPAEARETYRDFYSTHRLRLLAEEIRGTAHADLFASLRMVMCLLGSLGAPELGLPVLGSYLWSDETLPDLMSSDLSNADLLEAVRALGFTRRGKDLWRVDYRNLGSEELGSVYESLLELHPEVDAEAGHFSLSVAAGHERKTTGSYYTPHALVQSLLETALDPVLEEAAKSPNPEAAILALTVCDPATGSGHFLIAAAHRIARRLASVRTGDEEPSPKAMHRALRDVIGRCLYGVDVNPMAVELCKVSLWMEALEPGKPLSFLDAHIQCGNSLLGTTPDLMAKGIPEEAFCALTGDDKSVATQHRKRNREELHGQQSLKDETGGLWGEALPNIESLQVLGVDDSTLEGIREMESHYLQHLRSDVYQHARIVADAWCAAFVWPRMKGQKLPPLTHGLWNDIRQTPDSVPAAVLQEVDRIANAYRFLHWHLAFPEVFGRDGGGFDVVLGNPPWDQVQLDPSEFFAISVPAIAAAPNMAAKQRLIIGLVSTDPQLHQQYLTAKRHTEGEQQFVHSSGRFLFTSYGRLNLAPLFAELGRKLLRRTGRSGMIVPTGIATDSFNQYFFQDIADSGTLASLYDFENREGIFPGVHRSYRFCLLTLTGPGGPARQGAEFRFFAYRTEDLGDPERRFLLTPEDFALMNPNTRTCPIFRSRRDAELTRAVYRRVPVLVNEKIGAEGDPWGFHGLLMFMMNTDSSKFRTREQLEEEGWHLDGNRFRKGSELYLPLYEGKMLHHFDHRAANIRRSETARDRQSQPVALSHDDKRDQTCLPMPLYWVREVDVDERLKARWERGWLLGWRDITSVTNERTVIASVLPRVGAGDTVLLMLPGHPDVRALPMLVANLDSFALDYAARQKVGGTHLKYHVFKQLPVLPPAIYEQVCPWSLQQTLKEWILPRVLELVYTAHDLEPFARDCGYSGPPFIWNDERRFRIRCELDAAFFHLYGIGREDVEYIMETFPIVKKHDEKKYGEYRLKRKVMHGYDIIDQDGHSQR
jgi:hypothetical protein